MDDNRTVAVVGTPASYRRGVEVACAAAGWRLAEVPAAGVVVITPLRRRTTCDTVEGFVAAGCPVVALLEPFDRDEIGHALGHGATPADWEWEADRIVAAAAAALAGDVVLPREVAAGLLPPGDIHPDGPLLTAEEVAWLMALSRGTTVARLADDVGFSERAMFRRLADLYARIGVAGRTEAIVMAERHGLLRDRTR